MSTGADYEQAAGGLSELFREHLRHPRHGGVPAGALVQGRASNPACGDELVLHLARDGSGGLQPGFQASACSAVLAFASMVCERLAGATLEEARALDLADLAARAGGLPPQRAHAIRVVARALEQALDRLPS